MLADQVLREAARAHPSRPALIEGDRVLTYADWDRLADAAAARLRSEVAPGEVVALHLGPSVVYPVLYFGVLRAGGVVAGINPRLGPEAVEEVCAKLAPALVIEEEEEWLQLPPPREPVRAPRRPGDVAAVVLTGGTTGTPKAAAFTHRALLWVAGVQGDLSTRPGERRIVATPPTQAGFMTRAPGMVRRGDTLVFLRRWRAGDVLEAAARHQVSVLGGVPAQWVLLLRALDDRPRPLPHLRLALAGGAPVAAELADEVRERLGVPFVVRYSCTEAGAIAGTRPTDDPAEVRGTVGRPVLGVEVRIAEGEIMCRSPAVMSGYWRDPQATGEVLDAEGWLRTGDLGRFDERGNLIVCGRRKEVYLRGGYNVFPAVVEDALRCHPQVAEAAVVGVPDEVLGERGVAFVVTRGGAPDPEALRELVRRKVADYAAPDEVVFVDDLPRTAALKADKRALAERVRRR